MEEGSYMECALRVLLGLQPRTTTAYLLRVDMTALFLCGYRQLRRWQTGN